MTPEQLAVGILGCSHGSCCVYDKCKAALPKCEHFEHHILQIFRNELEINYSFNSNLIHLFLFDVSMLDLICGACGTVTRVSMHSLCVGTKVSPEIVTYAKNRRDVARDADSEVARVSKSHNGGSTS